MIRFFIFSFFCFFSVSGSKQNPATSDEVKSFINSECRSIATKKEAIPINNTAIACLSLIDDWLNNRIAGAAPLDAVPLTRIAVAIGLGYGFENGIDCSIHLTPEQLTFYKDTVISIGYHIHQDSRKYISKTVTTNSSDEQMQKHLEILKELMFQSTDSTKPIFEDVDKNEDDEKLKRAMFRQQQAQRAQQQAQRNNPAFKAQQLEQKLQDYLSTTRILQLYPQAKDTLKNALRDQIQKLGNEWPGKENLEVQEQFFWNVSVRDYYNDDVQHDIENIFSSSVLFSWKKFKDFCNLHFQALEEKEKPRVMKDLLPIYQAFPDLTQRDQFIGFCTPYLQGLQETEKSRVMNGLFPIYQAFPDLTQRDQFIGFCTPFLQGCDVLIKQLEMKRLLPIYQAFPEKAQRDLFIEFCTPFLQGLLEKEKPRVMNDLLPIYQTFPDQAQRNEFISFYSPWDSGFFKTSVMKDLLPIYQAFPDQAQRNEFINFYNPYIQGVTEFRQPELMKELLPIYQAFPDQAQRNEFIEFCTPFLQGVSEFYTPIVMNSLLRIYQAFPEKAQRNEFTNFCTPFLQWLGENRKPWKIKILLTIYKFHREDFKKFIVRYPNNRVVAAIITSYAKRLYLHDERVRAALQAEGNRADRQQPMYEETELYDQLPVFYAQDPLLAQARGTNAVADAHDFDAIYEQEYPGLQRWCSDNAYVERQGATPRTIHNRENSLRNYTTNAEVEDFIAYLDALPQSEQDNVSIIKQMLGLEAKADNTTGRFAPYLGHSMYFAKPSPPAPKGDEMLAKVWFMMKKIGEKKPEDAEDYKKSVMLAILEAAEIQNGRVGTHCQTRITGELMKCIAWHLPDSRLRPLIAAEDVPPVRNNDDIKARIILAPDKGKQIFKKIHRCNEGNSRSVWMQADGATPELWQIYTAYYDDLYRRRINPDGTYAVDENILTRDAHGNLAKRHRADGTLREPGEVEIVYYQSEFQVLEQAFTECMRLEFEEQRGLIY